MVIAGTIIFSIAWLLVFTGIRDAMGPISRRLKKAQNIQHKQAIHGSRPRDIGFCSASNLQTL